MNMCVIDEHNPCECHAFENVVMSLKNSSWPDLREHAILTLHNLLEENDDNQAVVNSMQPTRMSADGNKP